MKKISDIVGQSSFSAEDLVSLLGTEQEEMTLLFTTANQVRQQYTGKKIFFRGLIELSNICGKDCLYCGIRKSNEKVHRYSLSDKEILDAARFAYDHRFGSVVVQSGEIITKSFAKRIEKLLVQIKALSNGQLGITLSLGEQDREVYRRWFEAGAHRYLLRMETTNQVLYERIHPKDQMHEFQRRLNCLSDLKDLGFQTGTGVMIGLPFQTFADLAGDLLFFRDFDVDMVGMGPYLEHSQTPLYEYRNQLLPLRQRFDLSLKMISALRLLMKDINIAATTALQVMDPRGREKALKAGANIIMPNITPPLYRSDYLLYDNKPCITEYPAQCVSCLDLRISFDKNEIGYAEWGDSQHFSKRGKSIGNEGMEK